MLIAELIAASTGIFPKKVPTKKDILAAQGLLKRWENRIAKLFKGEQQAPKWREPPDGDEFSNRLAIPMDDALAEDCIAVLGDEVGAFYVQTIQAGREYIAKRLPQIPEPGIVAKNFPIPRSIIAQAWEIACVLDDPEFVIDEMDSWTLTLAECDAINAIFPELAGLIDRLINDKLAEMAAAGQPITWQVEQVVKTWKRQPLMKPMEIQPQAEQESQAPSGAKLARESMTPSQRAELKP